VWILYAVCVVMCSVVNKALDVETETKTEAAGFETEPVYLETEAVAQGSWPIIVLSCPHR